MKKTYLIIISFTLMLFSLASFINQHYFLSIVSIVFSTSILSFLIIIENEKITFNLLDLTVIALQLMLISIFIKQLKEISVGHVYISILIVLFNIIYHKAVSTLSIKKQKYCYSISILLLSSVFGLVVLFDLILLFLFSFEGILVINYLIFLLVICFPTLLLGLPSFLFQQQLKAC